MRSPATRPVPTSMASATQTAHLKSPSPFRSAKLPRSLSASSLKNSLSKLTTPLSVTKPVAALHANVKYVFAIWDCPADNRVYHSFVPAKIPRKRRFQMLAVALWSVMIVVTTVVFLLLWYVFPSPPPPGHNVGRANAAFQLLPPTLAISRPVSYMDPD